MKEGEPTGWNPAALPPTKRNIAFMKDLVRLLCTLNSEPLDDYQNSLISDAVERLMQRSDRSYPISKLRPLIQEPDDTETKRHGLKARLKPWTQGKSLAGCSTIGKTRLMSITWMFSVLMERSSG